MAKIEYSVVINRPVQAVWDYMFEPGADAKWQARVVESTKTTEGPIGVGTRVKDVRRFLGREVESEIEITEWEPNKSSAIKLVSGPVPFTGRRTLESVDGGTRVTDSIEAQPEGIFKLAEPIMPQMARREIETDYAHLKDLLESGTK